MSKFNEQSNTRSGFWATLMLTGIAVLTAAARADEARCEVRVQGNLSRIAVPELSELPLVGQLFKSVTGGCDACADHFADHLKAAGAVIETPVPLPGRHLIIVKRVDGQQCPAECAAGATCGSGHCCACETQKADLAAKHAAGHPADSKPSWEQIVELASEKAALEAALEAHEAIAEAKDAMFESLAELIAEKSALEAQVKLHAEHSELSKQVQELAAENVRLKTQIELANVRMELLQKTTQVAAENEQLKHRIAELERHFDSDSAAARTAKRNSAGKKVR